MKPTLTRACSVVASQNGKLTSMTVSSKALPTTELPPPDIYDPVIEVYKRDVDRTLLRERLKLTPAERAERFKRAMRLMFEIRRAGQRQEQAASCD